MLKLLRNHVMDGGVRLPSGAVLDKTIYLKLLGVDNGEFRLCHKLTMRHVTVRYIQYSTSWILYIPYSFCSACVIVTDLHYIC